LHAGIRYQDIHPAEQPVGLFEEPYAIVRLRDVDLERMNCGAGLAALFCDRFCLLGAGTIGKQDRGARGSQSFRGCCTNPRTATGHDAALSVKRDTQHLIA